MGFIPSRVSSLKIFDFPNEVFPLTHAVIQKGLEEGVAPGVVAGFWKYSHPNEIYLTAHGQRRTHPSPQPLGTDTRFDLASLTKVIVTAPLFASLVESKELQWETPVCRILTHYPHYEVTIGQLLSHTSGLPAWIPLYQELAGYYEPQKLFEISVEERQEASRDIALRLSLIHI